MDRPQGWRKACVGKSSKPTRMLRGLACQVGAQNVDEYQPQQIVAGYARARRCTVPFEIKLFEQESDGTSLLALYYDDRWEGISQQGAVDRVATS
jgi:hypothetical protein